MEVRARWREPAGRRTISGMNILAADYPFLDIFWTMLVFFGWVIWFTILIKVLLDIFRRHDASGWTKAAWVLFVIVLPFLGVLVYLGINGAEMAHRDVKQAQAAQSQMDDYVRSVSSSGGATAEIERGKALLDSGAISHAEFETLKAKALS
jgi:hypothetical protein